MSLGLNPVQKEAVLHQDSPLLILAGAGTGKTRVLTERIIYLINSYIANPYQILAVTFTNKAASEMKYRINLQIGDLSSNIWMGTFHGIATRILKRHPEMVGLKADFTIIDSDDCLRLLKQITTDLGIDSKEYPPKTYQYQIERLKDKALLPSDLSTSSGISDRLPKFSEIYSRYQNRLQSLNCADFGDLLLYNLKIFEKSPETLEYYQNKFQQILVDEYQDTNKCQYQWLLLLAGSNPNICAVGDDDQSIYSWRGAEVANILRFEKDFSKTKIIRLEQNYRSTSNILAAASNLIKNNSNRHGKTLWTDNKNDSQEKIKLLTFLSDRMEASAISDIIFDLQRNSGIDLRQIAILVRAGYQTRSFEEAFMSNGLPYRIVGGLKFYDRREIRDAIAYLRVIHNPADDLALERIVNVPRRGLGQAGLEKIMHKARDEKCPLFVAIKRSILDGNLKGKSKIALEELINNLEKWQGLIPTITLSDLVPMVLEGSGYVNMWKNEKTPDASARVENLQEFAGGLTDFDSLAAFLDHVSLVSGDEKIDRDAQMVNIMTVHSAKGLEFDAVFIPGLEEGVFPSGRALNERNGMEEERRLLYVAITRARKILHLSFAQNRFIFGQMQVTLPSPFIKELPEDVLDNSQIFRNVGFNEREFVQKPKVKHYDLGNSKPKTEDWRGKRIFHQKFGYGRVLEVDGEKLKIKFEKSDIKTMMKSFIKNA
ncbi:MAG: DNA helicase-2/ATP-dependent DNA helicase PcrA [Rickettsiales bacterium]|jgi:DNA helicase-2/ATP-dependent DNA helicase PcrA